MSTTHKYAFGMIGLGTMGRNLLLNMADHDFAVCGYDTDPSKGALLEKEGEAKAVKGFSDIREFVSSLQVPRSIMMLVPAGKIVDNVIEELIPLLDKGDILIDGGNSHFTDTNRRVEELESKGFHFFGMGVSGGEEGARRGPSMMPGGDPEAYKVMQPIFEAIAAKVDGVPCVTYIGPGASGHFVKMVHNGIEYGLMELLSEAYGFLKNGLHLDNAKIESVFSSWNQGRLKSFLVEITKDIFAFKDPATGVLLVDEIKDEAKAKGTGKWTSQIAMDLDCPTPTIDSAVSMRDLSKYKSLRVALDPLYRNKEAHIDLDVEKAIVYLEETFYFATMITYAQGMHLLAKASEQYKYNLSLTDIAKIWRGGCIIRSEFLKEIYTAFGNNPKLAHLLLDPEVVNLVKGTLPGTRTLISSALKGGISFSAFASCLSYFDSLTTGRLPSNLIQAQRDYFGAHTYELIGKEGVFHTQWH
jgi:6-phosphogluconate dehydrogenase